MHLHGYVSFNDTSIHSFIHFKIKLIHFDICYGATDIYFLLLLSIQAGELFRKIVFGFVLFDKLT